MNSLPSLGTRTLEIQKKITLWNDVVIKIVAFDQFQ